LAGGVSNVVLLVSLPDRGERFVLKQARGKLRVKEDWQCSVERIWREVEVLRICGELLAAGSAERETRNKSTTGSEILAGFQATVPQVLWEDRKNYAYAMTAAPVEHRTWKELLLAREIPLSVGIATACGKLLAAIHAGSWNDTAIAARLDDRTFFDQLRLDPYYRHVARMHPDLAPQLDALLASVWTHRRCLVHGDYSPKNLLVWAGNVMLIDFEVGHYGDPAFDLGFFLTHLVLKAIWSGSRQADYLRLATVFWRTYCAGLELVVSHAERADLEQRTLANLAGCLLARVDGKSPVDYLAPPQQTRARALACDWLRSLPANWDQALARI
jgi:5-methylthioribose kinase